MRETDDGTQVGSGQVCGREAGRWEADGRSACRCETTDGKHAGGMHAGFRQAGKRQTGGRQVGVRHADGSRQTGGSLA